MLIVIAGTKRSASTWLYNIGVCLAKNKKIRVISFYETEYTNFDQFKNDDKDFVIIKSHIPSDNLLRNADFIFITYRDPITTIKSLMHTFKVPFLEALTDTIKVSNFIASLKKKNVYYLKYESKFYLKMKTLNFVNFLFNLNLNKKILKSVYIQNNKKAIISRINYLTHEGRINSNLPNSFDKEELWHSNHIGSMDKNGFIKLSIHQKIIIFKKCRHFYKKFYPVKFFIFNFLCCLIKN